MAEDKRSTPNRAPDQRARRSRPAPTIDLTATEVAAEPEVSSDGASAAAPDEKVTTPGSANRANQNDSAAAPRAPSHHMAHIVAGCVGGAIVALILIGVLLSGYLSINSGDGALRSQIASLQTELQAFGKRDTLAPMRQALDDIKARIDKVDQVASKQAAGAPGARFGDRLAAIENSMKSLGIALTALNRRSDENAAAMAAAQQHADAAGKSADTEIGPMRKRLDALEQSAKTTQDKVAQNAGADTAARRALAALALRDAVTQSAPYAEAFAAIKDLGVNPQALAALEPFAATGIPADAALSRELSALLPKMIDAAGADATKAGGFFERLEANAGKLVRIRPVGEPAGDDPSAVLARIEVKLAHNDIAGAAIELPRLPAKARAVAEPWNRKVVARNAAVAAGRKLAADSAGALGAR
jgi:hypothetical protein